MAKTAKTAKDDATAPTAADNDDAAMMQIADSNAADSLTPEERAALADNGDDGDDAGDEAETDRVADAGEDAEDDGDTADAGEDDDADTAVAEAAGEAADDADDDGEDDGEADPEADAPAVDDAGTVEPVNDEDPAIEAADQEADEDAPDPSKWMVPNDINEQIAALKTQADELSTKFDEGDLSAAEYRAQVGEADEKRRALQSQFERAQQNFQTATEDFVRHAVKPFIKANPQYKPDNQIMFGMLDAEVRRLQGTSANPFLPSLLSKAHRNIVKAMGGTAVVTTGDAGKTKAKPVAAKAKPPAPKAVAGKTKPAVPPTLARTPASDISDTAGGKFTRLDRLASKGDGSYEAAIEKLRTTNPAAYEEYMAS
ncbi:MAG: hypothetical protein GC182_08920 [Rhodopseudomonas sp.]|nr:hypothetical protein [Rhodopseudomonas sp.]